MSDDDHGGWTPEAIAEEKARRVAEVRQGICPDSGLRLHAGGETQIPPGTLSCDMCDCFGYDPRFGVLRW